MRRIQFCFAFVLSIFFLELIVPSQSYGAEPILKLPRSETKLPNGLTVVLVKYPSPGVIAYQLPVRVGSRNEVEKGKTGFAHFFEHLMFKGTKKRTAADFSKLYNRLGCENNAWTSDDMTNYHGVVSAQYLPQILDAEADRFMNLQFEEKVLKDEAGAVLGEYNKNAAQPEFQMEEKLAATAFTAHTYGHTTMGYKEDILKYTERYADVWPFFNKFYRPENTSVILVGDVNFPVHLALVKKLFGKWKPSPNNQITTQTSAQAPLDSPVPLEPLQTEPREATVTLDKPTQTRFYVAYKVPEFTTARRDHAVLEAVSELYFSNTSDFQKIYKFEKKWLDGVSAYYRESIDPGLWIISLRLSEVGEGHDSEVLKAVEDVIQSIGQDEVAKDKLDGVKSRLRNAAAVYWFGSPESLASRLSYYLTYERDLGVIDRVFKNFSELTPNDIKSFAAKHLINTKKTVITLKGRQ